MAVNDAKFVNVSNGILKVLMNVSDKNPHY